MRIERHLRPESGLSRAAPAHLSTWTRHCAGISFPSITPALSGIFITWWEPNIHIQPISPTATTLSCRRWQLRRQSPRVFILLLDRLNSMLENLHQAIILPRRIGSPTPPRNWRHTPWCIGTRSHLQQGRMPASRQATATNVCANASNHPIPYWISNRNQSISNIFPRIWRNNNIV